jgi:hypothetical protein
MGQPEPRPRRERELQPLVQDVENKVVNKGQTARVIANLTESNTTIDEFLKSGQSYFEKEAFPTAFNSKTQEVVIVKSGEMVRLQETSKDPCTPQTLQTLLAKRGSQSGG